MTTRYGFEGDDPNAGTPPDAEKPNLAKTVFGHQAHLPSMPVRGSEPAAPVPFKGVASANEPRANQPTIMASSQHAAGASSPQPRQGPVAKKEIKPPAQPAALESNGARQGVARFLGRRNTAGNIVPLTQTELQLPKAPWVRPALTVGLAAIGSFLIVAALLWLVGPKNPKSPTTTPTKTAVQTSNPIAKAPPQAPPVSAVPDLKIESPRETAPVQRATVKSVRSKAGRVRRAKSADPDAPLPPTFF